MVTKFMKTSILYALPCAGFALLCGTNSPSFAGEAAVRPSTPATTNSGMKLDVPAYKTRPDNGYRGIWFTLGQFSKHGDKYSGGLGTYTANHVPLAVYAPQVDKTF